MNLSFDLLDLLYMIMYVLIYILGRLNGYKKGYKKYMSKVKRVLDSDKTEPVNRFNALEALKMLEISKKQTEELFEENKLKYKEQDKHLVYSLIKERAEDGNDNIFFEDLYYSYLHEDVISQLKSDGFVLEDGEYGVDRIKGKFIKW